MEQVLRALRGLRIPAVISEGKIADAVEALLQQERVSYRREALLSPGCRIDFLLEGGIGLEIKKEKPNAKVVLRQLERYAASDAVSALILISQRHAALPARCHGKPLIMLALQTCWGVTV